MERVIDFDSSRYSNDL